MRTLNFGRCSRVAVFFRLCLVTIVVLSLAMGGMVLNPRPAQAVVTFIPPYPLTIQVFECQPFNSGAVNINSSCTVPPCPTFPPETHFFWEWSGGWPGWLHLDHSTGALWGCPDKGAASYTATIRCWSMTPNIPPGCPAGGWCLDWGDATVILSVNITNPLCMTIDPVAIPLCWENAPFNMTCTVTGGVGPFAWTATGLPLGLTMDAAGNITGAPAPGTCNTFNNVTVTVTDTGYCAGFNCLCPTSVNRPFILFVDCWANYIPILFTTITTGCDQTVEIGPGLMQGQTNVLVDGTHVATLSGGQKYTITGAPCEGHTVMVDQTVQPNSNTKFIVIGSNIKTFSENDNYAFFDYAPEVEIRTASDPSGATQPLGAGFYAVGSYFSSTVPGTIETDVQNGKKLVFHEWKLPDNTTRPTTNLGFVVNQGGTVTAAYDTYYQLILHSDYPAFDQSTFEPAGKEATWNTSLHQVPVESSFWAFLGVTQVPVNPSGSMLMTQRTTIPIQWKTNYWPAIIAILILLLVIGGVFYGIRWFRGRPAAKPVATTRTRKASTRTRKRAK